MSDDLQPDGLKADHLKSDRLDRILMEQDTLLPSSGFAASVMDAIQQQASAPAPIPFPWKWAIPGICALLAAVVIVGCFVLTTLQSMHENPAAGEDLLAWFGSNNDVAVVLRTEAGPALLAVLASLVCIALCRRLAGRSA
jgi:hypothetical protein